MLLASRLEAQNGIDVQPAVQIPCSILIASCSRVNLVILNSTSDHFGMHLLYKSMECVGFKNKASEKSPPFNPKYFVRIEIMNFLSDENEISRMRSSIKSALDRRLESIPVILRDCYVTRKSSQFIFD